MSMTKTQQYNVPTLRFPEFSGAWEAKRIGEIATFQRGFDLPSAVRVEGEIPIVSSGGITGFHNEAKVSPPGIVTGRYGSIGDLFFLDVPFWPLNTSLWVKDFHGNSVEFAFYHLSKINFKSLSDKTGVPGINRNDVHKINSSIPPLPEQQKIASFLSSVDGKIEQLGKKKALLEQYKKGMMQKLFSQELRFKDAQGNDFPDWAEKRLGDVGTFKSGVGFSAVEQGGKEGTPFYKVSDMNLSGNEREMVRSNNYVSDEQTRRLKYKIINSTAIIFAKVGAAIFLERKRLAKNFLIDNNMMAFIPKFDLQFAKHVFDVIRLSKFAQTGALPSYNGSDLATIKICIPNTIEEQQKTADFLSSIDQKIDLVSTELDHAKTFKKGLLQQMFI